MASWELVMQSPQKKPETSDEGLVPQDDEGRPLSKIPF